MQGNRVPPRGTQVIGQRMQVGLHYAGQIVTIEVDDTTLRLYDQHDHVIKSVLRANHKGGHPTTPTVTSPTAKSARQCHPSPEANPSLIIWN
jgi:hypothetical protein